MCTYVKHALTQTNLFLPQGLHEVYVCHRALPDVVVCQHAWTPELGVHELSSRRSEHQSRERKLSRRVPVRSRDAYLELPVRMHAKWLSTSPSPGLSRTICPLFAEITASFEEKTAELRCTLGELLWNRREISRSSREFQQITRMHLRSLYKAFAGHARDFTWDSTSFWKSSASFRLSRT